MNLPNTLTLSRLVLALVIMVLLASTWAWAKVIALLLFGVAGFTDYLDGRLARQVYGPSAFGKLMDPLADKILVCAVFVSLVGMRLTYRPDCSLVPAWIAVVIISREFLVTGLRLLAASQGLVLGAGKFGKHKMVWQLIVIITLLMGLAIRHDILRGADAAILADFDFCFGYLAYAVSIAVAMITVASGALYFSQHRELIIRHM